MTVKQPLEHDIELRCFSCDARHEPSTLQTVCTTCGLPLRVVVPLSEAAPDQLIDPRNSTLWRYASLLPVPVEEAVSLGEGWTPVVEVEENLFVKDESHNPTGSFKDRGMSVAVSAARILGAGRLVAPSAGNAAVALSAYGRQAGLPVLVAMPSDTPVGIVDRCRGFGAEVELIDGDISVAGAFLAADRQVGDFDMSTLKEPYRVEGKKTMGYELWEQFDRSPPDVVIYPTGGGTGLVGMWKAWDEMQQMGWMGTERPRMVSVQSDGCAPIVAAYETGRNDIEPWPDPITTAWGLRVPSPIAGFLCLRAVYETGGVALGIPEDEIHRSAKEASLSTGIDFCPEGGAAWAAMRRLRRDGLIGNDEKVLVWNTGSGESYR